jgi:ABC-type transport system involved in multi-copper enzyme maturation permease subunit
MTFLPIVNRELRVTARRQATYSLRLLAALGALVTSAFIYGVRLTAPPRQLGHEIFWGLAVLALLYGIISGRRATADCLSSEKREGTLGLLFLTDLKGYDVVLGKLAANSLNGFYALLAIFPVLALPLLMGGITSGEFWRVVLVLIVTFLFSQAVAIFASVVSRDARQAMGTNFLLFLLLAAAGPLCAAGIASFLSTRPRVIPGFFFSCPGYTLYLAEATRYAICKPQFWWSAGIIHGLTWLLVALTSLLAPHSWRDKPLNPGTRTWRGLWHRWLYGTDTTRRAFRKRLLDVNAFYWRAARVRLKPLGVWLLMAFVAGWWIFMRLKFAFNWDDGSLMLITALMLNTVLKAWTGIEAGQTLAEEQKMGTLELLLSTPLRVWDILVGQLLALRRHFLMPLAGVIGVELIVGLSAGRLSLDSKILMCAILNVIMLLTDLVALIGVGMAAGLTARSPTHASVSTISRVLVLPWVGYFAIVVAVLSASQAPNEIGWRFYLYLWFGLGLLADLAFGLPAWVGIQTRFRRLALKRFTGAT